MEDIWALGRTIESVQRRGSSPSERVLLACPTCTAVLPPRERWGELPLVGDPERNTMSPDGRTQP